jgi:hypothetical protein
MRAMLLRGANRNEQHLAPAELWGPGAGQQPAHVGATGV